MRQDWWSVPGPAAWLEGILRGLRAGRNILLRLPRHSPPGLREAIEQRLAEAGGTWRWTPFWLESDRDGIDYPERYLWNRLGGTPSAGPVTAVTLARSDLLLDKVIWLEGLEGALGREWIRFLAAYADAALERESWDRGLFITCCTDDLGPLPKGSVGLAKHALTDVSGHFDMLLWTAWRLTSTDRPGKEEQLRIAVIAELAGADPTLADELIHASLESLLDPATALRAIATERGWPSDSVSEPHWAEGTLHFVDGQARPHSLFLAISGKQGERELQRRIWRAQVAVLFPFLEQERVALLEKFGPMLQPMERSVGERWRAVQELELSHILAQVRSHLGHPLRRRLQTLVRVRNALAHLETVDAASIKDVFDTPESDTHR